MAGGRPTDYNQEMLDRADEYINGEHRVVPTIERLALFLEISKPTIYEWEAKYPEFSYALSRLRNLQAAEVIEKGLDGSFNSTIAKLMLGNHGYTDKSAVTAVTATLDAAPPQNDKDVARRLAFVLQSALQGGADE